MSVRTQLPSCPHQGYVDILRLLRDANVNLDSRANMKGGMTPAWAAAVQGHVEVLEVLYESKVNLETPNDNGATPAHGAANNDQVRILQLFAVYSIPNIPRKDK